MVAARDGDSGTVSPDASFYQYRNASTKRRTTRSNPDWAVEYVSACAHGPLTVHDICRETGVSPRTLEYAFRARFDLSPKAYIRTYRLNRVRNDLRMSDPDITSITKVANRCGFRHMGQFAADYRNLFAALPSETLSRCRRVQEGN